MNQTDRYELALKVFLNANPRLQSEIDALKVEEADACDVTLDVYRRNLLEAKFSKAAEHMGIDSRMLIINLTAKTEGERNVLKIAYHHEMAEAIGVTWRDYLDVNPHLRALL